MPEPDTVLDPRTASTAAEYVELLRRLKDRSGLTYRQLEHKAAAAGLVLPRSTAATMLSRPSLPREELVVALVRATGGDESAAEAWVEARKQLAAAPEPPPDEPAEPPKKKPVLARFFGLASRPVWALVGALLTVFLLIGPGVSLLNTGTKPKPKPSPTPSAAAASPAVGLPTGPVQLYLPHSKLCMAEDPTNYSGIDFQTACSKAYPPVLLEEQSTGAYHLATQHPKLGPGCVGVAGGDPNPGAAVANGFCRGGDAVEYAIEPVTTPLRGYRIRPVHSGLCLGIPHDSTNDRVPLKQLNCDATAPGQVFTFVTKSG